MTHAAREFHPTTRRRVSPPQKTQSQGQGIGSKRLQTAKNYSKQKTKKKPLIAIVGPTGSGKTRLAISLAKKLGGELISADSRQIYRGLDIGTGKDKTYPHHLVDIVDVSQNFSVSDFVNFALPLIDKIYERRQLPIVVGGTSYYVDALLYKNRFPTIPANAKLRSQLDEKSTAELYQALKQKDPRSAERIGSTNRKRLIRALEIVKATGQPIPARGRPVTRFHHLIMAIDLDRPTLDQKIDRRVKKILKQGLIQETRWLIKKISKDRELAKTIGYKEVIDYLDGQLSKGQLAPKIRSRTQALARRQVSWWRRQSDIVWVKSTQEAYRLARQFLNFR